MKDLVDGQEFMAFVAESARLRLEAGHHPHDVLMTAWRSLEDWCRTNIDGSYPAHTAFTEEPK